MNYVSRKIILKLFALYIEGPFKIAPSGVWSGLKTVDKIWGGEI